MSSDNSNLGEEMHSWASDLFPICRSLTGQGNRDTLVYLKNIIPELEMYSVATGYQAFDWSVPNEWNIIGGYIEDVNGNKVIDFNDSNLHVMGYSEPVDRILELSELQEHLHSIPEMPSAIPYKTSYYKKSWGFCIEHSKRVKLKDENYRIKIESTLKPGKLDYADIVIPGKSKKEILISTYFCHPSMANNELSGPIVATAIARWLSKRKNYYTYRIVFVPETLGSIVYLSNNDCYKHLQENVIAGYVLSCVGDDRNYSYLTTPSGDTYSDKVAHNVYSTNNIDYKCYSALFSGSDERQYCSPLINLPIGSIMRTRYGDYPEYHTSLDDLSVVTPSGLFGAFDIVSQIIESIEYDQVYRCTIKGEPFLSKYGLYPSSSSHLSIGEDRDLVHILKYSDSERSLLDISNILQVPVPILHKKIEILLKNKLLEIKDIEATN